MTCNHQWIGIGCTTVCDPPIFHAACPKCRTFRHRKYYDDRDGDKKGQIESEWFSKDWDFGNWDWNEFIKNESRPMMIVPTGKIQRIKIGWCMLRNIHGFGVLKTLWLLVRIHIFGITTISLARALGYKG